MRRELVDIMGELKVLIEHVGSQAAAARLLGVNRSHITHLLKGDVEFGKGIARQLGFRRVVKYEPLRAKGRRYDYCRCGAWNPPQSGQCHACLEALAS